MKFAHNCTCLGRRWSCGTFLRSNPWGRGCGTVEGTVPLEGSTSSTLVINELSSCWENKHQRKEPTTITDLSLRKDISVIVGSTENNSSVMGAAGTGGGNHTGWALLQIHASVAPTSPKTAGNTAGGGYGWCRGCGWLWMGFVETRSVVLALPSQKQSTQHRTGVKGVSPPHPDGFSPSEQLWKWFAHSNTAPHSAMLHTQTQLHTMPHLHHTEHLALIAFNTHWCFSQFRTSQIYVPPVPLLTPAPDALEAEVPPVFPIKVNFSEDKYMTQSIVDEHTNVFALTFSTLYKKEVRELQANFLKCHQI